MCLRLTPEDIGQDSIPGADTQVPCRVFFYISAPIFATAKLATQASRVV